MNPILVTKRVEFHPHQRFMISLGLIDASWLERLPDAFRSRLSVLLADPDG